MNKIQDQIDKLTGVVCALHHMNVAEMLNFIHEDKRSVQIKKITNDKRQNTI